MNAGLFNVGIAGFAAIGIYFCYNDDGSVSIHFGGLDLPLPMAIACAMLRSGLSLIGLICISYVPIISQFHQLASLKLKLFLKMRLN